MQVIPASAIEKPEMPVMQEVVGAYKLPKLVGLPERWQCTHRVEKLIDLPEHQVIMGDEHKVRSVLSREYPAPCGGLEMIEESFQYHHDNLGNRITFPSFHINTHPMVTLNNPSVDHLTQLSNAVPGGWIGVRYLTEFHRHNLTMAGFIHKKRSGYTLIKWNPHHSRVRQWRKEMEIYHEKMPSRLPGSVSYGLQGILIGKLIRIAPQSHPCRAHVEIHGRLSSYQRDTHTYESCGHLGEKLESLIATHLKIWRKRWWREQPGWKRTIQEGLGYLHGLSDHVEAQGTDWEDTQKVVKFLKAEARALKLKIPPRPTMPQKPLTAKQQAALDKKSKRQKRTTKKDHKKKS